MKYLKIKPAIIYDVGLFIAAALIGAGLWQIYVPIAWIFGGCFIGYLCISLGRNESG